MARLYVVREWLWNELGNISPSQLEGFELDLEHIIDDFVFMCFLVGNDFLPHIPSLKITEGGIDSLMILYKILLPQTKNYITNKGLLNLDVLNQFLIFIGKIEEELLKG